MATKTTGATQPQVSTRVELSVTLKSVDTIQKTDYKDVVFVTNEAFEGIARDENDNYVVSQTKTFSLPKGAVLEQLRDLNKSIGFILADNKAYNQAHKNDQGFVAKTFPDAVLMELLDGVKIKIVRTKYFAQEPYTTWKGERKIHEHDGYNTEIIDAELNREGLDDVKTIRQARLAQYC